jgi:hypothetical protein
MLLISIITLHAQTRGGDLEIVTSNGAVVGAFNKAHALVIGESNYTEPGWGSLPSVKDDVIAVKKLLQEQNFIVETLEDMNRSELFSGIENFLNKYGHDENARLLVYYAGHGDTRTRLGVKAGYIVPVDAPHHDINPTGFFQKAINMNQFKAWSEDFGCRHILFIFDSCFSGTIFSTRGGGELPPAISASLAEPVRQFITSGNEKESVPEPSVFRPLLERALRNGEADLNKDGYITGTELGMYMQTEIINRYKSWSPQYGKSRDLNWDKGDFIFLSNSTIGSSRVIVPESAPEQKPVLEGRTGINFSGDTLTARSRQTIISGLRGTIQTRKINLDIDEKANVANGYGFTITFYCEQVVTNGTRLLKVEAEVAFSRDGRILCQSAPYYITETNETLAVRRIVERLKDDKAFLDKVIEAMK